MLNLPPDYRHRLEMAVLKHEDRLRGSPFGGRRRGLLRLDTLLAHVRRDDLLPVAVKRARTGTLDFRVIDMTATPPCLTTKKCGIEFLDRMAAAASCLFYALKSLPLKGGGKA